MITLLVRLLNSVFDLLPGNFSQIQAAYITLGHDALCIISWVRFFIPCDTILVLLVLTATWYTFKIAWVLIQKLLPYFLG